MKKLIITLTLVTGLIFNLKAQQAINATTEKQAAINKNKPTSSSILTKNEYGGTTGGVIGIQNDAQKLSKKGYDSYKAHSDMASVATHTNPYYMPNTIAGEMPKAAKKDSTSTQRRRVEVLKSNKTGNPAAKNSLKNIS